MKKVFTLTAWAYYGWNVAGWATETAGKAREWRANTVKNYRTHALWRLGHWGLEHHDMVWRTLLRAVRDFMNGRAKGDHRDNRKGDQGQGIIFAFSVGYPPKKM